MTFEERMEIIRQKSKRNVNEEKQRIKDENDKRLSLVDKIDELEPRIEKIILLANECIEYGINFPDQTEQFGYGKNYHSYNFFADGFFHHVGLIDCKRFWYGKGENPYNKVKYLGIKMGGTCGKYDFLTDGRETFSRHEDTKEKSTAEISHMEQFLREFLVFEKAFYKWIDSLEE